MSNKYPYPYPKLKEDIIDYYSKWDDYKYKALSEYLKVQINMFEEENVKEYAEGSPTDPTAYYENILSELGYEKRMVHTFRGKITEWEKDGVIITPVITHYEKLRNNGEDVWYVKMWIGVENAQVECHIPKEFREYITEIEKLVRQCATYYDEHIHLEIVRQWKRNQTGKNKMALGLLNFLEKNKLDYIFDKQRDSLTLFVKMGYRRYIELPMNNNASQEEIEKTKTGILELIRLSNSFGADKLRINGYTSDKLYNWKQGAGEDEKENEE